MLARACLGAGIAFGIALAFFLVLFLVSTADPACPKSNQNVYYRQVGRGLLMTCFSEGDGDRPLWSSPSPSPYQEP